jgi:hypothetical protein
MGSYVVHTIGPSSNPAHEHDAAAAAEAREAADASDFWTAWVADLRSAIEESGGDSEDPDTLLASVLDSIADEIEAAEGRAVKYAANILHRAEDSNHKVAAVLRREREAREQRRAEGKALAARLDRIDAANASLTQENVELRSKFAACEENLAKATAMLEREIAKERALRRLLDSQRNRPHTQRVASELARRFAEKTLEAQSKAAATSKTEAA